jgi:hypothetical protein
MAVCRSCKAWLEGNPSVCSFCGKPIDPPESGGTEDTLVVKGGLLAMLPKAQREWRSAEVGQYPEIELRVNSKSCKVRLKGADPVVLGRHDPAAGSDQKPDVDLSSFGAFERGVSRLHAALRLDGSMLMLRDLGSTNGTFVNGQRVTGGGWRVVRDQDELRLGSLTMTLNFETTAPLKFHFSEDGDKRP